ncbi:MAG: class II glutamine amidotransferase, partial [Nitrososphaeraceae archaeon]
MCGIVGVISKKGDNVVTLVESMLTSIACRGPDGAGIAASSRIVFSDSIAGLSKGMKLSSDAALGHVRLEIVGGTCGQQPFRSCDGRFVLEHNGEIYNYKKLRDMLRTKHDFVTDTDSEVIVHMVEDYFKKTRNLLLSIKKTVSELDGVYAIVIRDEETGEIVLIRDVMGVRQLYYGQNSQLVAFASERKALWKIGLKEPTLRIHPGST